MKKPIINLIISLVLLILNTSLAISKNRFTFIDIVISILFIGSIITFSYVIYLKLKEKKKNAN